MAARKKKSGKKTEGRQKDLQDHRHEEAKRKNNPEVGLSNWEPRQKTPPRAKYEYDPCHRPSR